jgi:protein-tyrosine phosphatase
LFDKVAASQEILEANNITRIINLAPSVVPNHFEHNPKYTYLSIDMIDGRQDDIGWFLCEVIQFVEVGRFTKRNTLIHCEKGISRSCSMTIAYIMWASGE